MRLLTTVVLVGVLGLGSWWIWSHNHDVQNIISQYVDSGEILTLEAKYTPDQIIETNRKKLLQDDQHTLQEPTLKFYPYLLLDVKYATPEKKTKEGALLWGMADGEIVINTDSWDTTHGFSDCLEAGACRNDFKVLQALASNKGTLSREELQNKLHVEPEVLDEWLESAIEKHLIVQKGNNYYLHFEEPVLSITPQTKINQPLVTKAYHHAVRVAKKYSASQIEKGAKAAFGADFTIRSSKEVFLPVYSIDILNPDGSLQSTQWNALNGQQIYSKF